MQSQRAQTQSTNISNYISLQAVQQFQLIYNKISVIAEVQVSDEDATQTIFLRQPMKTINKQILHQCSGKFVPGTFTAIVGPSGCGKTTMLNLLSGRLLPSSNLKLFGRMSVNGQTVNTLNKFKDSVGFVQQEDVMLPTFTPKQSFMFISRMRLPNKSQEQRQQIVKSVIKSLGLKKCQDNLIGDSLIKGISGGQKKRTSIGLQLLVNPSILFLDQPTTGLDSTTALNLIELLKALANSGRTVISTIHQPSSEIFLQFDKLLLMVAGNIVYNGQTNTSIDYFRNLGMPVPIHTNPCDHFMRIMNKQGIQMKYLAANIQYTQKKIKQQFALVVKQLTQYHKSHSEPLIHRYKQHIIPLQGQKASWIHQVIYLIQRNLKNQIRNPVGITAQIGQSLIFALFAILLFYQKANNFNAFDQDLKGVLFFIIMVTSFGGVLSSSTTFSSERPVFIRERISNTYDLSSYFFSRLASSLPALLIMPVILISVCYWIIPLYHDVFAFLLTILAAILTLWMSISYGYLLSAIIQNLVVIISTSTLILIPLMLVAGFFTPASKIFWIFRPFQYLSPFKYGYQAMIQIQYQDGTDWTDLNGAPEDILSTEQYNFSEPLWLNLLLLFLLGLIINFVGLVGLWWVSSLRNAALQAPKQPQIPIQIQHIAPRPLEIQIHTKEDKN